MGRHYFPLFLDLEGNNCGIMGGGEAAARCAEGLLHFGAQVTVVSPVLCPALEALEKQGRIRHIPRKFFRGDCSHMVLCVAATGDRQVNIAIAAECKAKSVPVYVADAEEYGTFRFPAVIRHEGVTVTLTGDDPAAVNADADAIEKLFAKKKTAKKEKVTP